jgi:hypothetical protein
MSEDQEYFSMIVRIVHDDTYEQYNTIIYSYTMPYLTRCECRRVHVINDPLQHCHKSRDKSANAKYRYLLSII